MHKVGEITTIVEDHVQGLAIGKNKGLLDTPDIFFISLALPGIDWDTTSSNSSSSMVLSGEDVARRPGNISTKFKQSLNENSSLDCDVKAASNPGSSQWLARPI